MKRHARTPHQCSPTCGHAVIGNLIDEWAAARLVLAELEHEDHPDITDDKGRTWVWWKGDLYRHDGKTRLKEWIEVK